VRAVLIFVSVVALAACGSSTAPTTYPTIGGQYAGSYTYQLTNIHTDTTAVIPTTITLNNANSLGTFTGFAVFPSLPGDSALIIGQFASNDAVTFGAFGDPNLPLLYSAKVLSATFPACNFADSATFTLTGQSFANNQLGLSATFTGFKCGSDSAATMVTANVVAIKSTN
jgi:hypothetical protein